MGTAINVIAIFLGALVGCIIGNRLPERISKGIIGATGLYIIYLGASIAMGGKQPMAIFISIILGSVIGEILDIEGRLNSVGMYIEKLLSKRNGREGSEDPEGDNGKFTKGFVSASLIFCIGPMAVMGAIQEGLTGEYNILMTKAMLDGITALALAPSLGIGVGFSGFSVLIYQGLMTIAASGVKNLLTDSMVNEMSAVGGLLIMGIGINLLGLKKIKIGNLLPSIFIALIIMAFIQAGA